MANRARRSPRIYPAAAVFSMLSALAILLLQAGCAALPVHAFSLAASSSTQLPSATTAAPTLRPSPTPSGTPTRRSTQPAGSPPQVADPLWVANEADGNLLLIDPSDNSLAVIVPTNLKPRWVGVGEGFVWALDPASDVLIQVDPQTYAVVRTITFPERDVETLVVGAGAVWVGYTQRTGLLYLLPGEDFTPQGGILRIDPRSGKITGEAQTGPVKALAIQASPAYLWALGRGAVDTPLLRIDPQTLAFQPVTLSGSPDWPFNDTFALTPNSIWLYSSAFAKLYRAAPDGRLYAAIRLGQHRPLAPAALLPAGGDIWLAAPWSVLLRFDPGQQRFSAEIPLEAPATQLAFAGGSIWAISALGGQAYRIDPASNRVIAAVPLGQLVQPTPRVSPTPILRASKLCEDAPYSRLAVGLRAATPREPALPNRIHKEPGKDADTLGFILPGQSVVILEGPECKDGWVWWKVRNEINKVEGWVAEGDESEYWLIPLR
jgi:hypothetical protein